MTSAIVAQLHQTPQTALEAGIDPALFVEIPIASDGI
jgi:hypothetical protein